MFGYTQGQFGAGAERRHQAGASCTTYALDADEAPSCLAPERSGGAKQLTRLPFDGGPPQNQLFGKRHLRGLRLHVGYTCLSEQHIRGFDRGVFPARGQDEEFDNWKMLIMLVR